MKEMDQSTFAADLSFEKSFVFKREGNEINGNEQHLDRQMKRVKKRKRSCSEEKSWANGTSECQLRMSLKSIFDLK